MTDRCTPEWGLRRQLSNTDLADLPFDSGMTWDAWAGLLHCTMTMLKQPSVFKIRSILPPPPPMAFADIRS
jgi:hypothetical protein